MRGTYTRLLEVMIALTALVGLLDAIAGEQADLALVFAIALALSLVLVARSAVGRREVAVRRDLAKWLADRAAAEDDITGAIADRALSAYRAGLVGDPPTTPGSGTPDG